MRARPVERTATYGAGVVMAATVLSLLASPPDVSGVDDQFVAALDAHGIRYSSSQRAIMAGHEVCDELRLGQTVDQIAKTIMGNSNLDGYRAGFLIGASIAAYCPWDRQ